jgi:hypothetical protein
LQFVGSEKIEAGSVAPLHFGFVRGDRVAEEVAAIDARQVA